MGSTISSAARTSARTALKEAPVKPGVPSVKAKNAIPRSTAKTDHHITARVQNNQALQYHRKTTEEWSETLKKISGAITSSAWEGEVQVQTENQVKERHSAQRSDGTNQRLPGRRKPANDSLQLDDYGMLTKPKGRVTHNEVLHMFNLRREDPQKWEAGAIAKKYGLSEEDVENLLSFSRTYTARMDNDGQVRGYYNSDPENTISRFERD